MCVRKERGLCLFAHLFAQRKGGVCVFVFAQRETGVCVCAERGVCAFAQREMCVCVCAKKDRCVCVQRERERGVRVFA